jgi:hypothetical protein
MRSGGVFGCGLGRRFRWIPAVFVFLSVGSPELSLAEQQPSERERTFLKLVFNGDEAKAAEYAQVANINVNSIAGEPLSAWFYKDGHAQSGRYELRFVAVQKIVFERFRQNPNPSVGDASALSQYCSYAPVQQNFQIEGSGAPDQIKALREAQDNQRRPHIDSMGAGFESLVRYGLKDRGIITRLFRGCIFKAAVPLNDYFYDTVLSRMVRAGADINGADGGERAIQYAFKTLNAGLAEKLVRDGAGVKFAVGAQCGMNAVPSNLYGFLMPNVKTRDQAGLLRLVAVLAKGGLSPMASATYVTANGYGSCVTKSLYDAAVDTGDLDLAKRIKEAAGGAQTSAAPVSSPQPSATSSATVPAAPPTASVPSQIGAWQVVMDNGRLVAVAKADKKTSNGFAALRLECVGGKLEYAPVALKLNGPMTSLWISIAGDAKEMKLVNQRASGPSATTLSNEFAANEPKAGEPQDWGIEMTVQSWNSVGDNVVMTGFSKMRAFMRANCKS